MIFYESPFKKSARLIPFAAVFISLILLLILFFEDDMYLKIIALMMIIISNIGFLALLRGIGRDENISENVSSLERSVASTSDSLSRQFKERTQSEIDEAVRRLAATADEEIKQRLDRRIDVVIGNNIVSLLGARISAQTNELAQTERLRTEVGDRFIQMRNRVLQYADSASRQSTFFRTAALVLAILGIATLERKPT